MDTNNHPVQLDLDPKSPDLSTLHLLYLYQVSNTGTSYFRWILSNEYSSCTTSVLLEETTIGGSIFAELTTQLFSE
jgi:hypothetical protein